ncbi:MAG: hypothetical protein M5R41_15250 [Bacteroidia bacterium]|nr:hypothetical protein [Bacteroidia bacterium]
MKNTKYLFTACLFVMMTGNAIAQTPELNDYWQNFVSSGANILSGYTPDPNSVNLGSNIAGYHLGRFGLHGLIWGHLTWVRSPEYADPATTDGLRR